MWLHQLHTGMWCPRKQRLPYFLRWKYGNEGTMRFLDIRIKINFSPFKFQIVKKIDNFLIFGIYYCCVGSFGSLIFVFPEKSAEMRKIMGYISFGTRFFVVVWSRNAMLAHLFMGCFCQKGRRHGLHISHFLRFFVVKKEETRKGKKCIGGCFSKALTWIILQCSKACNCFESKCTTLLLHAFQCMTQNSKRRRLCIISRLETIVRNTMQMDAQLLCKEAFSSSTKFPNREKTKIL